MVEVFKTNVQLQQQALVLVAVLSEQFPLSRINFDLDDCDRILRVEGKQICPEKIIGILTSDGYQCCVLD